MNKRIATPVLAAAGLGVVLLCCWSMASRSNDATPQQLKEAHAFREKLAGHAAEAWGRDKIGLESLQGPDDALELVLRAAEGSCREPVIHLFILNAFGTIGPVKTITCNERHKTMTVEVTPYIDRIRAMFPIIPDKPDTKLEFGGTVTEMSPGSGEYKRMKFESRQALIDYLQIEPRGYQFASTPKLHKRGLRVYAAREDDRILVIETVACDMLEYRVAYFASDGLSRTTVVKWTELGGTYMVCKGDKDMGLLGMRAANSAIDLYPVNSIAECTSRRSEANCN